MVRLMHIAAAMSDEQESLPKSEDMWVLEGCALSL